MKVEKKQKQHKVYLRKVSEQDTPQFFCFLIRTCTHSRQQLPAQRTPTQKPQAGEVTAQLCPEPTHTETPAPRPPKPPPPAEPPSSIKSAGTDEAICCPKEPPCTCCPLHHPAPSHWHLGTWGWDRAAGAAAMGHNVSYMSQSGARASSLGVEAFIKDGQDLFSGCWHYAAKRAQPCLTPSEGPSEGRSPAQQGATTSRSIAGGSLQPTSLRGAGPAPVTLRDTAGPWPYVCSLSTCMQWPRPCPRHATAAAPTGGP